MTDEAPTEDDLAYLRRFMAKFDDLPLDAAKLMERVKSGERRERSLTSEELNNMMLHLVLLNVRVLSALLGIRFKDNDVLEEEIINAKSDLIDIIRLLGAGLKQS